MVFHDINQGKHLIYYHLMYALMSICDYMSFKISSFRTYLVMVFENNFKFFKIKNLWKYIWYLKTVLLLKREDSMFSKNIF